MEDKVQTKDPEGGLTIKQIADLLDGKIVCGEQRADEMVTSACGSDLMSDVLAFTRPGSVLMSGLTNPQVIRTAEMLDLKAIVFVRNKQPDAATIKLAKSTGVAVILSPQPLYESCGRLYTAGLSGCQGSVEQFERKCAEH